MVIHCNSGVPNHQFLQAVAREFLSWINCKFCGETDAAYNLVCLLQFTLAVPSVVHWVFVHRTLNNNFFSGIIPESFGNLASLQYLAMQTNHIQGSLPAFLGNLTALLVLYALDISYAMPFLVTCA
jgi:hypothetical protein